MLLSPNWHILIHYYHNNFTPREIASLALNALGTVSSFCRGEENRRRAESISGDL